MDWIHIGEMIVAGGMAVLTYLIIQRHMIGVKRKSSQYTRHFENMARVYTEMNAVLQKTAAKRVLVLKTTNGGGRPRIGATLYASVVYEDFMRPMTPIMVDFQNQQVDGQYVTMLSDVARRGSIFFDVSTMDHGMLRRIYEAQKIRAAVVFYVAETSDAFYYGSVSTDAEGAREFSGETDQIEIELFINRLKEVFRRAQK